MQCITIMVASIPVSILNIPDIYTEYNASILVNNSYLDAPHYKYECSQYFISYGCIYIIITHSIALR